MATDRQTLAADGSTNWVQFKGPVWVSFYGTFGGGTAKIQRQDSNGDTVDVAVAAASSAVATDFLLEYPPDDDNTLRVTLTGSTTPAFICELNAGYAFG